MLKQTLVSIGVPCYNNSAHIQTALHSLIRQTYKNIEIIITDDASTDTTFTICQKIAKKDKRIRLYRQKRNLGTADNFTFALKKAKGKFFMWAAGDDIRDIHCVEELIKLFIDNPDCVLAVSAIHQFSQFGTYILYPLFARNTHPIQAIHTFLHHQEYGTLMVLGMYRTEILLTCKGYHKDGRPVFKGASEFITVYRILLQGDLGYVNKPLLHKRDSGFFLSKYEVLQSGSIPSAFIKSLWRYLRFPEMFVFDLYYSLAYTFHSSLSGYQKMIISVYCIDNFILQQIDFLSTICRGAYMFMLGLFKRIR